jgi:hypothetical protein
MRMYGRNIHNAKTERDGRISGEISAFIHLETIILGMMKNMTYIYRHNKINGIIQAYVGI